MKNRFNEYQRLLEKEGDKEQKRIDHCQVIDEYYHENIIQIENSEEPIQGREKIKEIENKNLDGISAVKTQFKDVVIDDKYGIAWGQMIIWFNSKKSGKTRIEEAFIQKWSDGKIYYQRFFYGPFINED